MLSLHPAKYILARKEDNKDPLGGTEELDRPLANKENYENTKE
jgi:hypothetical protein